MKNYRQKVILDIIARQELETQAQLMDALAKAGIPSTQATVSRDIKELRLVKDLSPAGKYRYAAAREDRAEPRDEVDPRLRTIFRQGVVSCSRAQNLIVLKTLPGLAQAVCSAVDVMDLEGLVGSLGGDDTAFLAMRDRESAETLIRKFDEMLRNKQ